MKSNNQISNYVNEILHFGDQLIGTPYKWWLGEDMRNYDSPHWTKNEPVPSINFIKESGCNCIGLLNLMRRYIGLKIYGTEDKNNKYVGGTVCWYNALIQHLKPFDINLAESYPKGSVLLKPYIDINTQGHVAVIYGKNQIIHCFPYDLHPNIGIVEGGVNITEIQDIYKYICPPEYWLSK